MADTRKKNFDWCLPTNPDGTTNWTVIHAALLMDLRDHLKTLNELLGCYRFMGLPDVLSRIDRRLERNGLLLTKRRRRRKR